MTTQALVLREVAYKESDKLLTLLTADRGRLTVSARGARKKQDAAAAACQSLVWGEFTLWEYRGRWTVKEAFTLRRFHGMLASLEKLALGTYFAEVAEALSEEEVPDAALLSLTLNSLHALDKLSKPLPLVKAAFEGRAMSIAGYEPLLERCALCGKETPEAPMLNLSSGLLHCAHCRDGAGDGISMPLDAPSLSAARHIVWGEAKRLFSFSLEPGSLALLSGACEAFLMTQLERGFHTLDFYKQVCADR